MATTQNTTQFLKKRKFLAVMPLLAIPFLLFAFYSMDGGKGEQVSGRNEGAGMGFNTQLPKAQFDKKDAGMNKLAFYKKADQDSLKRHEFFRQDPYHSRSKDTIGLTSLKSSTPALDPRADALIKKLDLLRQSIRQPNMPVYHDLSHSSQLSANAVAGNVDKPGSQGTSTSGLSEATAAANIRKLEAILHTSSGTDTPKIDPQLMQLSKMLDKVIALQRNKLGYSEEIALPEDNPNSSRDNQGIFPEIHHVSEPSTIKTAQFNDSSATAIPAIVQEDQTLVAGATIALRLPEESTINRVRISKDELVYGVVSINNDRMLIHINSIRFRQSIYFTALQVYDMDGLPGIHIPDMLNRDVAKESADQGVNSMNLAAFDPGIGAQAANAGIQAAKSLISRKVRLVRVSVKAGYQVLLRNTKGAGSSGLLQAIVDTEQVRMADSILFEADSIHAPSIASLPVFLHKKVSNGKVKLILEGIYLRNDIMWFSFRLKNRSRIDFSPAYTRCFIEDKKKMKRTAYQETPLYPLYQPPVATLEGDTELSLELGFRPFSIANDKKMVVQMADRDGGRQLDLAINPNVLLKAK
jgi:conjugative transposon TraM protein